MYVNTVIQCGKDFHATVFRGKGRNDLWIRLGEAESCFEKEAMENHEVFQGRSGGKEKQGGGEKRSTS